MMLEILRIADLTVVKFLTLLSIALEDKDGSYGVLKDSLEGNPIMDQPLRLDIQDWNDL